MGEDWDIEYGDRKTQFVIIGQNLDTKQIEQELDACLVNSDELEADWTALSDPYGWVISEA